MPIQTIIKIEDIREIEECPEEGLFIRDLESPSGFAVDEFVF